MDKKFYTIGMAGHIDHGKTTLTKVLTNVNTDRLKEEMERKISIELGYAPLDLGEDSLQISIIDVPGHERFIRQMIAGVAGIDLVILVIAADEGVMPQTREHVEILTYLGIEHAIIALTKIDRVEEEFIDLVREDIVEQLEGTVFETAPIVPVDSLSHKGIEELKQIIKEKINTIDERTNHGAFRLPIDQVFTLQGQGTIVRGTVFSGEVYNGDQLYIMPSHKKVKVRQIQSQNKEVKKVVAGQRAAINIAGISRTEVKRGDVLVSSNQFQVTDTIDITLQTVRDLTIPLKQRAPIKLHIHTAEVMGKIVFFDRNELSPDTTEEVLCQIRLDEPIVAARGDRFIIRRPTPVETIGGGWIIDPIGKKYKFSADTIKMLQDKKEGTPFERIAQLLREHKVLSIKELSNQLALPEEQILEEFTDNCTEIVKLNETEYMLREETAELMERITSHLENFHEKNFMRTGINKAELIQIFKGTYPQRMIEYVIDEMTNEKQVIRAEQYIRLASFTPRLPTQWQKRIEHALKQLEKDELQVQDWELYLQNEGVPKELFAEIKYFLLNEKEIYPLTDKLVIHHTAYERALDNLQKQTAESFSIKEAKDILGLSRKYLIPFLELLDENRMTKRDNDVRKWV